MVYLHKKKDDLTVFHIACWCLGGQRGRKHWPDNILHGAEIFLLADSAIMARWKFVSNRQEETSHNCNKKWHKKLTISLFSQYDCMVVAGGNEGQLAVVGEEDVHSTLDFAIVGSGEGGGVLQWLSKGARDIVLGRGLHKCISDSHRLQLLTQAVAVLFLSSTAWSHD